MTPEPQPRKRSSSILLYAVVAFIGLVISAQGLQVLAQLDVISRAYASVGVIWTIAGPAALAAAIWAIATRGRKAAPLWIAGSAAALSGLVLVVGVLTYVIPCAGPS